MSGRLKARLSRARDVRALTIGTFHSICLGILKETRESVNLVSESDALEIAGQIIGDLGLNLSPKKDVYKRQSFRSGRPWRNAA